MKPNKPTITISRIWFWYIFANIPMLALTFYVHYLLTSVSFVPGNNFLENAGLWLLLAFKIIGVNMILWVILSDFKIKRL